MRVRIPDHVLQAEKRVHLTVEANAGHLVACGVEVAGVGLSVVAQRIAFGGDDGRGGRPERSFALPGWSPRVVLALAGAVLLVEVLRVSRREKEALAVIAVALGGPLPCGVEGRVDEHLVDDRGALASQRQRGRRREIASGDGNRASVHGEPAGTRQQRLRHREGIVECRRERVLGGETVVDVHHRRTRVGAEVARGRVRLFGVAEHPPTAMQVDEAGLILAL